MWVIFIRSAKSFCTHSLHDSSQLSRMILSQRYLSTLAYCGTWSSSSSSSSRRQVITRRNVNTVNRERRNTYLHVVQESDSVSSSPLKVNLLTILPSELETLLDSWGYPKYRASQILQWVHAKGVDNFDHMLNIPKDLRHVLSERTTIGSLHLQVERISKDGTRKRAYRLFDGQLIESVLMPYEDGRNTACISSQAGCAQVFPYFSTFYHIHII